jgi:hypothetical protein
MQKYKIRVAPSLGGGFAGTFQDVWGVETYNHETDTDEPCIFAGLYGLNDLYSLWRHGGKKICWWAGSDITHFLNGYWLDEEGKIRLTREPLAQWLKENCEHYVENEVERDALRGVNIEAKVVPSFLGNVDDYPVQELRTDKKRYYTSVSSNDFELYGWNEIPQLAKENKDTEYHLYGNTEPWKCDEKNVIIHGRIPQEEMNTQVKSMTGGLRLTKFDGASEILVKSTLWGQKPLSPYIPYDWLGDREKLLKVVNKFPWNVQNN